MSRITSLLTGFLQNAIYLLPAIAISLSVHELCHGYTAYRLGDPTAKSQGRLTLNPLAHMDPLGTLCLLLLGFGWAKPVPVNPMYFRDRRKGMALTSAAGPAANLVLAFPVILLFYLLVTPGIMDTPIPYGMAGLFFLFPIVFFVTLFWTRYKNRPDRLYILLPLTIVIGGWIYAGLVFDADPLRDAQALAQ